LDSSPTQVPVLGLGLATCGLGLGLGGRGLGLGLATMGLDYNTAVVYILTRRKLMVVTSSVWVHGHATLSTISPLHINLLLYSGDLLSIQVIHAPPSHRSRDIKRTVLYSRPSYRTARH